MKAMLILALLFVGCNGLEKGEIVKQIVSGYEAENCEFPHMAYLLMKLSDGGYSSCGGSLIDDQYILTAAHCVNEAVGVTAYLGHVDNRRSPQVIKASRWTHHAKYSDTPSSIINDIAMIRLERPVRLGRCVKTISLPRKDQVFTGTCIAAGWGRLSNDQGGPNHMRKTLIKVIPTRECQRYDRGVYANQHICVGDRSHMGKNICQGDSGGPLMCRSGNKYVAAGVASYIFDCESGFGVYANVAAHLSWVIKTRHSL